MIRRAIVLTLGDIRLTADARMRWIFRLGNFPCQVSKLAIESRVTRRDDSMLIRHDFYKIARLPSEIASEASLKVSSRKLLWLSAFWFWTLCIGAMAAEPEKLNAGYSIYSGMTAPFWTTKEAGLFEKNGLNVQLIFLKGGTEAAQALITETFPLP